MSLALTRRKSLLALLNEACVASAPARVSLLESPDTAWSTRMLALEPDGVLLRRDDGPAPDFLAAPGKAEVRFDHAGERYAFLARTRGAVVRRIDGSGLAPAVKLSLPLRVLPMGRRARLRFSVFGVPTIVLRLTNVLDKSQRMPACLTDASDGGLGAITPLSNDGEPALGSLWYAEFETLDEPDGFEFVVRLAHSAPIGASLKRRLGWAFAPCDDPGAFEAQLIRLKKSLIQMGAREERPPGASALTTAEGNGGTSDDHA